MEFEKKLQNETHWKHVFSADNIAHRSIKLESSCKPPMWFPTSKSVSRLIQTREPLMYDLLIHLDVNSDVIAIAEYPEEAEYWTVATNGEPTIRSHVPNVAVLMRDGLVAVIDVMSMAKQAERPGVDQRTDDLKAHYQGLQAHYVLLDEKTIRQQPLFDNRRHMWSLRKVAGQHPDYDRVARSILKQPLPMRIRDLMRHVRPIVLSSEWSDETGPVFTAVAQLAMAGQVQVDMNGRFSQHTVVRFPPRLGEIHPLPLFRRTPASPLGITRGPATAAA